MVLNPYLLAALKGESKALSEQASSVKDSNGNNIAHYAASNGQLVFLQQLKVSYPLLLTNRDNYSAAPLLYAAGNGQLATVQWLLHEGGAKITEKTQWGQTALLYAARRGHLAVVQWLLSKEGGAKVTEKNQRGQTALLHAAQGGHLAVVQWLLSKEGGAKITEKSQWGYSILLLAVCAGQLNVVQWLLRERAAEIPKEDREGNTMLRNAAHYHHFHVVRWLIADYRVYPEGAENIARLLGAVDSNERFRKAEELRNLFYEYYKDQQRKMSDRSLEVGLPSGFPKVLRAIINEYAIGNDEKNSKFHSQIVVQNKALLEELKAHAEAWNPFLKWQGLSKQLVKQLSLQHPHNALTIHTAVKEFLAVNGKKIAGSQLFGILENILSQTRYLELPAAANSDKEELKENKQDATIKEIKSHSVRQTSPQQQSSTSTAITANLICGLKNVLDPQINNVAWQGDGRGGAVAYFHSKEEAQKVKALLHQGGYSTLVLSTAGFSSSSLNSTTTSYSLHVYEENSPTAMEQLPHSVQRRNSTMLSNLGLKTPIHVASNSASLSSSRFALLGPPGTTKTSSSSAIKKEQKASAETKPTEPVPLATCSRLAANSPTLDDAENEFEEDQLNFFA